MALVDGWVGETFYMKEKYLSCTFMENGGGGIIRRAISMRVPNKLVHEQMKAVVGFSFEIFRHFLYLRTCV